MYLFNKKMWVTAALLLTLAACGSSSTAPTAPVAPTVTETNPTDSAVDVTTAKISSFGMARFDSAMDKDTINSTNFTFNDSSGNVVPGKVRFDVEKNEAYYELDADLISGTTYKVTLTTGVTNTVGTPLAVNRTWSFKTAVTAPMPIALYKFDDGSGADSSGNNNSLTFPGTQTIKNNGVEGQALHISDSNSIAMLPTGIVSSLNEFTVASYVYIDTLENWSRIFDFGTGTSKYMFLTPQSRGATFRFAIAIEGAKQEVVIEDDAPLPTQQWVHVAVTLKGSSGTLYLNGEVVGSNENMTLSPSDLGDTTKNFLGESQFESDPTLKGAIDNFGIYDKALTNSEIKDLLVETVAVNPVVERKLNDTGFIKCASHDGDGESNRSNRLVCKDQPTPPTLTSNGKDEFKNIVPASQDALIGLDATDPSPSEVDGHAGFSFSKRDNNNNLLKSQDDNFAFNQPACIFDNVTKLYWESKTGAGLHNDQDLFTWFNSNEIKNGGVSGTKNSDTNQTCDGFSGTDSTTYCNTEAFISRVNTEGLCSFADWRLPTAEELLSLMSYDKEKDTSGDDGTAMIDRKFFEYTLTRTLGYLTSQTDPVSSTKTIAVDFSQGRYLPISKSNPFYIRLVRDSQ
jgi:hypothetical protein